MKRTNILLTFICAALAPSIALALPSEKKSQILATDDHQNIARTLELPDGLPDRDVANLADGSICLDGGIQCFAMSYQDPDAIAILVQDRGFGKSSPNASLSVPLKSNFDENSTVRLWDNYIARDKDQNSRGPDYIIGVVASVSETYSGGCAGSSVLYLYDLQGVGTKYPTAREILAVPFDGEKTIRACFSEKDVKNRKGACHDIYEFMGRITLAPTTHDTWPVLNYSAKATAYPRGVNVDTDNSARIMTSADLVSETDTDCTYSRTAHYNPLTARYEFAEASPDCREYLVRYGE